MVLINLLRFLGTSIFIFTYIFLKQIIFFFISLEISVLFILNVDEKEMRMAAEVCV